MDQLLDYVSTAKSAWTVWLMALFLVIVVRALWPGRKAEMNHAANIPLDDDRPLDDGKDDAHAH